MNYLLDASVFLQLSEGMGDQTGQGFVDWVAHQAGLGVVASVGAVSEEICATVHKEDLLQLWVRGHKHVFLPLDAHGSRALPMIAGRLARLGDMSALHAFLRGADLFILAQAYAQAAVVVTCELPKDGHWKITVPDACAAVGVRWLSPQQMLDTEGSVLRFPG